MRRDLSLSPRVEEKRELKVIELPVQFSLKEIKEHFEEYITNIELIVNAIYDIALDNDIIK
nr:hypothetical protein [uncultured Lachnoanaerobaculum sp.]